MPILNINTNATALFSAKLEKLSRSALPVAVRGALNAAALDVKQNTMPAEAAKKFTQRRPQFLRAKSRVEFASGWDINSMRSTVGFSGNEQAVEDLNQQEESGKIKGRSFIPLDTARVGNSYGRNIQAKNRLGPRLTIVDARKMVGANPGQKFVKAVLAAGVGGLVLADFKGETILWRVNSLKKEGGHWKLTALYTYAKGRKVDIHKATHFMANASRESSAKMEKFFIEQAEKQFAKALK